MKYCIHGRSEKQKCKICLLRSDCCSAEVLKPDIYTCTYCGRNCAGIERFSGTLSMRTRTLFDKAKQDYRRQ